MKNVVMFITCATIILVFTVFIKPIDNVQLIEINKESYKVDEDYLALIKEQHYNNEEKIIKYIITNEITPSIEELNEMNKTLNNGGSLK